MKTFRWLELMTLVLVSNNTMAQMQVTQEELNAAEAGLLKQVWPGSMPPLGSRLMMATIRDGVLWTCQQIGVSGTNGSYIHTNDLTGTNVDRSAAQWLRLATDTNGNFASITNGRVYDPSPADPRYYYFPSLMVNKKGDMVMGFSGSRSNEFIGAFYSYRAADGTVPGQPLLLNSGQGPYYPNSRWGDYSNTSLDPTDGMRFWTVQQYAESDPFENPWGTWISEVLPKVSTP